MHHILLPTDFSENAFLAAQYAARLFGAEGVTYTLMHTYLDADPTISSWTGLAEELHQVATDGMRGWEAKVRQIAELQGAPINTEVIYGPLAGLLTEMGEKHRIDLVVMGTLGRSGAGILGSNAVAAIKQGTLPILVVPAKAVLKGTGRILVAVDQRGMGAADIPILLEIAERTRAELVLAHVPRGGNEASGVELPTGLTELFSAVPHRFIAPDAEAMQASDVAAAIDHLATREDAGLIAVLHRHTGFLEGLFRRGTAKRLALHTATPLLVLQDRAEDDGAARTIE